MPMFAKLFERDGKQVLVQIGEDDPELVFKFKDDEDGCYITPTLKFSPKTNTQGAIDAAWGVAEKAFNAVTEDGAFDMRSKVLAELGIAA